uniref:Uncharacterized protein n=1 Tax=Panagrolaimus sp. JU765 TaxID=591449 RepID=A0AC34QMP0_9BILA
MFKLIFCFVLIACFYHVSTLECYTGYSLVRGQTVGTTTQTCSSSSDQCYKANANINLLNRLKLAGCSTFRCMLSRNKCQTQEVGGQTIEFCCCNDQDLCNGPKQDVVTSTFNKVKDSLIGNVFKGITG